MLENGGGVLLKWLYNCREFFLNSRLNYCIKRLHSKTLFMFLSSSICSTTAVLIKIFETRCNCAAVQNTIMLGFWTAFVLHMYFKCTAIP